MIRILLVALCGVLVLSGPYLANAQTAVAATPAPISDAQARAFVSEMVRDLAGVAQATPNPDQRRARMRALLEETLALDQISRLLLGAHAAAATPAQRNAYNALAPGYIANQFAGQIDALVTQRLNIDRVTRRGARGAIVRTSFPRRRDGSIVTVDWRLDRDRAGNIRLLDVYVNGVSPLVVKREEFSSVITRNGFDALLAYMRRSGA